MGPMARREYIHTLRQRYLSAPKAHKRQILDEFCATTGYHRKAAIRVLRQAPRPSRRHGRPRQYDPVVLEALKAIWQAAGYPWSVRLKALLPLWLPWARPRFPLSAPLAAQLLALSPRTIDRYLHPSRTTLRRNLYGRTKPGTLLKHAIPIKADRWNVTRPGFAETDLVAHCGTSTEGEYCHSLNLTDIHSTWVETCAVLGKSQRVVTAALDDIIHALPFPLCGLDADNGTEFINDHLFRYCRARGIQLTRIRPYKKDDNAHIEQKNWTHVRRLIGWDRYDTAEACATLNDLYRNEWRLMMNLFQPSVKLVRKVRVGSRLKRMYDQPQTPLDRLLTCTPEHPQVQRLQQLRQSLDPFTLAEAIERKVEHIYRLASRAQPPARRRGPQPFQIVPSSIRRRRAILPSTR